MLVWGFCFVGVTALGEEQGKGGNVLAGRVPASKRGQHGE